MFLLCRPFFKDGTWQNDASLQSSWGLAPDEFACERDAERASVMLLPFAINHYISAGLGHYLREYDRQCADLGLRAFAFVAGDWGAAFPEYEHITYFRMSGQRSSLSARNQGFPAALSDHYLRLYRTEEIEVRPKRPRPVVGFCGHATLSTEKRLKEHAKVVIENLRRAARNPLRKDWEPLFASAYQRASVLKRIEDSDLVDTEFLYREHYRAGSRTAEHQAQTTFEYYENLRLSDYVLCVRGGGTSPSVSTKPS
jgi:hypothetical protein